ncbi:hypothetical protein PI124_g20210 [Phytophthora idaei]|nr:hypothetical protein PI125_g22629 [Phytophthora idaei]KAG3129799.1 hypothetical protein PI126_g20791 [Phytophthora idaei]KAG3234740.1 hypothetical protein PI124_g20210 [Phytophthora idaei]
MQLRVDWVEFPQAVHNRIADLERQVAQLPQARPDWVADLERQVAQLHGQLVSLLCLQLLSPRLWPHHPLLTSLPWLRHYMPTWR